MSEKSFANVKWWRRMRRGGGVTKCSNCFGVLLLKQSGKHKRDLWNSVVVSLPVPPVCLTATSPQVFLRHSQTLSKAKRVGLLRLSSSVWARGQEHPGCSERLTTLITNESGSFSTGSKEGGCVPSDFHKVKKKKKNLDTLKQNTTKEKKGGDPVFHISDYRRL